jgi:hypothetical protein
MIVVTASLAACGSATEGAAQTPASPPSQSAGPTGPAQPPQPARPSPPALTSESGQPSLPPDYTLVLEASTLVVEFGGPVATDVSTPWVLDPCVPTAYPSDRSRTSFRSVTYSAGDAGETAQVATYVDAAAAEDAVAGFGRAVAACGNGAGADPVPGSGVIRWTDADVALGPGEEALYLVTEHSLAPGVQGLQRNDAYLVARFDNAVLVYAIRAGLPLGIPDDTRVTEVLTQARPDVQRLREAVDTWT